MYGCPCYKYKDKLFAFLVTNGVVLTKASERDKIKLSEEFNIKLFQAATGTMKGWPQIPIDKTSDLKKIIPFIKNSYNNSKNLEKKLHLKYLFSICLRVYVCSNIKK
jgi:hypothetical protein